MASVQFENLKKRWEQNRISETMLRNYVKTGRITEAEYKEITKTKY